MEEEGASQKTKKIRESLNDDLNSKALKCKREVQVEKQKKSMKA